jgi:uncharacterized protein with beta-barrel porin domain
MAQFATLNVTVTTAGTRVQVSTTDLWVKKIVVRGHAANTGHIYLGTSTVSSTVGLHLKVGDPPLVIGDLESRGGIDDVFNLKNMYIDSSVNGEKLSILYFY